MGRCHIIRGLDPHQVITMLHQMQKGTFVMTDLIDMAKAQASKASESRRLKMQLSAPQTLLGAEAKIGSNACDVSAIQEAKAMAAEATAHATQLQCGLTCRFSKFGRRYLSQPMALGLQIVQSLKVFQLLDFILRDAFQSYMSPIFKERDK